MSELDKAYLAILRAGLESLRNAAQRGDQEYCIAESEHLHNLPSLIGEENVNRHIYYATAERAAYLEWACRNDSHCVRVLLTYFYPAPWRRIDELLGLKRTNS